MVISTLALLSSLFMVAFEVSRASPTKEIQGESMYVLRGQTVAVKL